MNKPPKDGDILPSSGSSEKNTNSPEWRPPYIATTTFSRLAYRDQLEKGDADVAILGIPWDGLVTYRPGTRFGPREMRQASFNCRSYSHHMEVNVYNDLSVVDVGDIEVSGFDYKKTFDLIEERISELNANDIKVVSLGGDHSILLPILRAVHKKYANFKLIQFDAHTDTTEPPEGQEHHHGTCVRDAIEEGLISGSDIFQIGIRGSFGSDEYLSYGNEKGINVLNMHECNNPSSRSEFIKSIIASVGDGPCYITFDIDSVDPAFAPGTGTPVPGGLTSFQAIDFLRELRGLNVIGGDVVEVSPVYDNHAQITSLLGSNIAHQILALIALSQKRMKNSEND